MRITVSVPEPIFTSAERLARRLGKTRSALYAEAVREYVAHRLPDAMTEAMDRVCAEVERRPDRFASAAARRALERSEW